MSVDVHLSRGDHFEMHRFATKQGSIGDAMHWSVGDFDGDGKTDLMKFWNANGLMRADVHLSKGDHFEMKRFATDQGGMWDGMKWFVGDFDGDGKADLMKLWKDGHQMNADVHISDGAGFAMHRFATDQGSIDDSMRWVTGDFNGDGKLDVAKFWSDGGKADFDVHLSTGTSFVMKRFATKQGSIGPSMHWSVGDYNGDGKDDLLKYWNDGDKMTVDVHASNGTSFAMQRFATKQGGMW